MQYFVTGSTAIRTSAGDSKVTNIEAVPAIEPALGVSARAYWGSDNLMSFITLDPDATILSDTIKGERFMFIFERVNLWYFQAFIDLLYSSVTSSRAAPL